MPESRVLTCHTHECIHNKGMECHAMSIDIGDERHAMCETFEKGTPGSVSPWV